jgi:hypothetical protein
MSWERDRRGYPGGGSPSEAGDPTLALGAPGLIPGDREPDVPAVRKKVLAGGKMGGDP